MATITFLGRDDDWENLDNWGGHALPVDDDDVVVPETAKSSLMRHLNRRGDSGGAGLDLNSWYVHPGYRGNIGCEGNPLRCIVQNAAALGKLSISHEGSGRFYYSAESGTGINTTAHIAMTGAPGTSRMILSGDSYSGDLYINRGALEMSPLCTDPPGSVWLGAYAPYARDAVLVAHSMGALDIDDLYVLGGRAMIACNISHAYLRGGSLTQNNNRIVYAHVGGSAQCIYNSSDNITAMYLYSGLLDFNRTANAKTITSFYQWGGVFRRNGATTVTTERSLGLPVRA